MIEAGEVLQVVTESMAPGPIRTLLEFLKSDADLLTRWRSVVERCDCLSTHDHLIWPSNTRTLVTVAKPVQTTAPGSHGCGADLYQA